MNRTEESARLSLSVWKRLLPYMKSVRRHFIMALVLMIVSALISSAYPVFTAFAVSAFIEPGQLKGLPLFVVAYFAAILVDGAASLFFFRHSMKVELYLAKDIRRKAFVHLQELSIPFFNKTSVGYLLARVMSDVDRISSVIAWGMTHALWNVGYVVGAFVYMFILKPSLALMLLAYVPVITAVVWFFQSKIIRVQRKVREVNSEITGAYNEGITGAKVTKTLVIEDVMAREFSAVTQKMYRYSIRSSRLAAFLTPLMSIAGAAAVGTVLYKGGLLVGEQLMDFGVLSALITYALGIVEPIVQLVGMLENVIVAQWASSASRRSSTSPSPSRTRRKSLKNTATCSIPKRKTGSLSAATSPLRTSPSATPTGTKTCCTTLTSTSRRGRPSPSSGRRARGNRRSSTSPAASSSRRRGACSSTGRTAA